MISRAMSSNVSRVQGKFIRRPFGHFGVGLINQIEVPPSFLLSKQIDGAPAERELCAA